MTDSETIEHVLERRDATLFDQERANPKASARGENTDDHFPFGDERARPFPAALDRQSTRELAIADVHVRRERMVLEKRGLEDRNFDDARCHDRTCSYHVQKATTPRDRRKRYFACRNERAASR